MENSKFGYTDMKYLYGVQSLLYKLKKGIKIDTEIYLKLDSYGLIFISRSLKYGLEIRYSVSMEDLSQRYLSDDDFIEFLVNKFNSEFKSKIESCID